MERNPRPTPVSHFEATHNPLPPQEWCRLIATNPANRKHMASMPLQMLADEREASLLPTTHRGDKQTIEQLNLGRPVLP